MLDVDPWIWSAGLIKNPGTANRQPCPTAKSCSTTKDGVNLNDACNMLSKYITPNR